MAAKRNSPGTYTENGVRCTMNAPFDKGKSVGSPDHANKAPFSKPQDLGNGGIPTKFFDTSMAARSGGTVNAGMKGTSGVNLTAPVGKRRFK